MSEKKPSFLSKPDKKPDTESQLASSENSSANRPLLVSVSMEQIRQVNADSIQHAGRHLELIGPSLRDLANRIEHEQPDALIFLDKSARPLGTPFMRYLREKMGTKAPAIRFYNDAHLKQAYLDNDKEELEKVAKEDFGEVLNAKIFFIDETYSRGRGAAALESVQSILGPNIYYFALTTDPTIPSPPLHRGDFALTEEQHQEAVKRVTENPNFVTYPNPIHNLFTRDLSRLYVEERGDGSTYGIWGIDDDVQLSDREISIRDVIVAPEGIDQEEFQREFRSSVFETVRAIKQKIYDTLSSTT